MGTRKAMQPARKRPVYVNGVYCPTLTAGAEYAGEILSREVKVYEIQRAANGVSKIPGIDVREEQPAAAEPAGLEPVAPERESPGAPLLRYPLGETPLDRGTTKAWS